MLQLINFLSMIAVLVGLGMIASTDRIDGRHRVGLIIYFVGMVLYLLT